MPGFKLLKTRSGFEPAVWISLSGLLLLGILSSTVALFHLPTREALRANETGQRAVIDPATGLVSLSAFKSKDTHAFDVGEETSAPPPAVEPAPVEPITPAPMSEEKAPEGLAPLRTEPTSTTLPETPSSDSHLVAAPAPEVSEKSGEVILPKRNGTATPATIYARRFTRTPEQHLLSVVIMDAGLSAQSLPLILSLPKDVTLAFSAYATDAPSHIAAARRAGYEVWSMLPAMSGRYPQDDPGPLGLVSSVPKDEVLRRLHTIMAGTLGSVGVVLPPDEALTTKTEVFSPIIAEIDARGLNVLITNPARTAQQVSGKQTLASTIHRANIVLDPVPDEQQIEKKLAEIEALLSTKEEVVMVASARPQTLLILQRWFKEHPQKEPAILAPLSAHWLAKEAPAPVVEEKKTGGH